MTDTNPNQVPAVDGHANWPTIRSMAGGWLGDARAAELADLERAIINLAISLANAGRIDPAAFCREDGPPFDSQHQLIWHLLGAKDPEFPDKLQVRPGSFDEHFATAEGRQWLAGRGLNRVLKAQKQKRDRKPDPDTDDKIRTGIELVLKHARAEFDGKQWPGDRIAADLIIGCRPKVPYKAPTVRAILTGTYKPMTRLAIAGYRKPEE